MKVARWGNSLAVRLPRRVAEDLSLKEGDEIELRAAGQGRFDVARDRRREDALAGIAAMRRPLPIGYKFDRHEIYDRFGADAPGRKPYDDD